MCFVNAGVNCLPNPFTQNENKFYRTTLTDSLSKLSSKAGWQAYESSVHEPYLIFRSQITRVVLLVCALLRSIVVLLCEIREYETEHLDIFASKLNEIEAKRT